MTDQEEHADQSGSPTGLGLILNSDAWNKSLPVTVWDELREADRHSVEYFARRYATAIYCYYRKRGLKSEEAKDLTMDFIVTKMFRGDLVRNFRPGEHRFRDYLLRALKNYLTDHVRKERRIRALALDPIIENSPDAEPRVDGSAETAFICGCVQDQLKEVVRRVKSECERDGLADHFTMFIMRLFERPQPRWEQIAGRFGIGWQEAKNKAWTVRDRLKRAVLEEFKTRDMSDSQGMDEIRELIVLFEGRVGADLLSERIMK